MIEFTYTYVLPVVVYLFFVSRYISYKENEENKIPFK